jgi:hypothetical protein
MAHWSQALRASERVMARFDYGTACTTWLGLPRDCNRRRYGQDTPPQYNLTAITTPLALITGGGRTAQPPPPPSACRLVCWACGGWLGRTLLLPACCTFRAGCQELAPALRGWPCAFAGEGRGNAPRPRRAGCVH